MLSRENEESDKRHVWAVFIGKQIVNGLAKLHSMDILHRDIKWENILIFADGSVKLTDFGLSSVDGQGEEIGYCCATLSFMAPEIKDSSMPQTYAVDIFATFSVIFEINFLKRNRPIIKADKDKVDTDAMNKAEAKIFSEAINFYPERRPTAEKALNMISLVRNAFLRVFAALQFKFYVSTSGNHTNFPYVLKQENPYKLCEGNSSKQKVDRSFHEQIFGIYFTYCLYFLQPQQYVMPIRVSVMQMEILHTLISDVLMPEEHFEPLFCLFRLVNSNAFTITPFETEFNPLLHKRFDTSEIEATGSDDKEVESTEDFLLLNELQEDNMLKRINYIHQAYANLKGKCGLAGPESGLNLVSGNLCNYIQNLMQETRKNFEDQIKKNMEIRHDAYSIPYQQERHRRHRQGPDEKVEGQERTERTHSKPPTKSPNTKKVVQKKSPAKKHLSIIETEVRKELKAREKKASERRHSELVSSSSTTDQPSSSCPLAGVETENGTEMATKKMIKPDLTSEMDEDEQLIKERFLRIKAQLQ
uniref:Protein kinase domain-containing protein n=1 Tax=Ditylenchus dipsaci TaxID=166011 RepID=A0A915DRK2_9BILA